MLVQEVSEARPQSCQRAGLDGERACWRALTETRRPQALAASSLDLIVDYPAIGVQKEVPQTFNPDDHITDGEPVIFTRGSAREGGLMSNAGSCGRRSRNSTALICAVGEDDRTGQARNGDAMLLMAR